MPDRSKSTAAMPSVGCSLQRVIAFASCNQAKLADMIEDAVLNISDFTAECEAYVPASAAP